MEDVNSWMRDTHEIQENLATKISNDSTVLKIGKKKIHLENCINPTDYFQKKKKIIEILIFRR